MQVGVLCQSDSRVAQNGALEELSHRKQSFPVSARAATGEETAFLGENLRALATPTLRVGHPEVDER